jgi:acyl-CoA reductase-like NAD-dependent aldehyde dehydrogenase
LQDDICKAVAAAKAAFKRGSVYRNLDASARGYLLSKLADLIDRDAVLIAVSAVLHAYKISNSIGLIQAFFRLEKSKQ